MHLVPAHYLLPILLFCLAAAHLPAAAQPDTRGREFYLTFPPNFHNNLNNPAADVDSLYIFIAATEPTVGQIVYRDVDSKTFVVDYSIADPSQVYTFGIPWQGVELRGFNDSGIPIVDHQSGSIAPQSFLVTSDRDVAVYALNRAETTSDAMLVLPTDVLGRKYRVMAYNSDFRGNPEMDTPSQLAIVATRNNTQVTITPTVPVAGAPAGQISIVMNAGDSYMLQAAPANGLPDLTGTVVESSMPVAVFGSHQRTRLPVQNPAMSSRDHLVEQIPPVDVWGKSYILTPFPPTGSQGNDGDMVRVLATDNNTQVFIGGILKAVLQAGQIYEEPLTRASLLTASRNVLVAQYKQTSRDGSLRLADPFMIIIPPRKQFLQSYLCINAQSYADDKIYFQQYMTLISHKSHITSITLDGEQVDPALFREVPGTCYMYAWVPTIDGSHRVESQHPFGLYIYGYGMLDSYGYTGGMAFLKEEEDFIATTPDTTICQGDSVQLFITGGTAHSWSPGVGLSCTDCSQPIASPAESRIYTVSFIDAFGCENTRDVRVDVQPYPTPVVRNDTTVCIGQPVSLTASGGQFYTWSPAEGLSCTDCASPTATPEKTTTYKVIISNGGACFVEDSVTITIEFSPADALPSDTLMCMQDSIAFDLPDSFTYKWLPATGLSCSDCHNPVARPTKTTKYTVVMDNAAGCKVIKTLTINVVALPIVSITPALTLCDNAPPVRLQAKGGNYYNWSPAEGLSCTDCASPTARPSATTTYTVRISITNTCAATTTVTVRVAPAPSITVSNDTTICLNSSVQLHASGGTSYKWSPPAGLSCTDCPDPVALPMENTLYKVVATSDDGCTVEDSVHITVISPTDIAVSPDVELCRGESASLSASGGQAYRWSPAEGLSCTNCPSPKAAPDKTTTYTVEITSSGDCAVERTVTVTVLPSPDLVVSADTAICRGKSVELRAAGGTVYQWSPAAGLSCTDCPNPLATPATTTRYYVTASEGACSQMDSVLVEISPCNLKAEFAVKEFPPVLSCDSIEGRCVFLNTGEDPIVITGWQINGADATSFSLRDPAVIPPHTLTAGDSVVFDIMFRPQQAGKLSATLDIAAQDAKPFRQVLSGEGYRRTLSLSLGPDITTSAGDTIAIDIRAACDNWSEAQIREIDMEIGYRGDWLTYSGTAVTSPALDQSWTISAGENAGLSNNDKTLRIRISGATHLVADGTIATVHIVPFLTTQQVYTPSVSASAPERLACVTTIPTSNSIDLWLCVPNLRPVRYNGARYLFELTGGTLASDRVQVRYGVGLQAHSTIELYDCLGQLVRTIDLGTPDAGDYRHELDMRNLSSGLYLLRYSSGPYSRSIPFLFGAE